MNNEQLYFSENKTEEVQEIIERMPTTFGFWVSSIVIILFTLLLLFGWLIRYPDVVTGQVSINTVSSPLKLIANTNGKLKLNGLASMQIVKNGDVVAYIDNSTSPKEISYIDSLLKTFNPIHGNISEISAKLPHNISLGELNSKYYTFVNALQEYSNYKIDKLYDKQGDNLNSRIIEQKESIKSLQKRVEMANNALDYAHKFYKRDSLLFKNKVISESELDKSEMNYLSSKDALQSQFNNLINAKQSSKITNGDLEQLAIQIPEKNKELHLKLISSYNDLVDNIKSWEQKYVFRSPMNGRIQFLKFYSENQFIQAGEQVFTIIPEEQEVFGQVTLPTHGSGKIKIGQEVIVKLDNYPYLEYGSIKAKIKSISLTSINDINDKNDIETYMVLLDFPSQLKTNYGTRLDFKAEAKGSAEIITNDRRLIQRLFDNLKYIANN